MAIAFDKDGKEVAHASDTFDGAIPQAAYDAVMKQGLPANQEIELKPGTYNLRLGVMDRAPSRSAPLTCRWRFRRIQAKSESRSHPQNFPSEASLL